MRTAGRHVPSEVQTKVHVALGFNLLEVGARGDPAERLLRLLGTVPSESGMAQSSRSKFGGRAEPVNRRTRVKTPFRLIRTIHHSPPHPAVNP